MSASSHRMQIMAHFKRGLSLTELESFAMFGKLRLAARINELREHHRIDTVLEPNGNGGQHGRYFYIGKKRNA